jgi:YHS domain-containing protein
MIRTNIRLAMPMYLSILALLIAIVSLPGEARAESAVNVDRKGVAIKGYDPVAYFTMTRPVKGKVDFEASWMGATWRFASARNRDTFLKDPEKYAPRYGGYCAYGVANNYLVKIDPKAWTVYEGRLYLNYSLKVREQWKEDIPGYIRKADANWPGLSGTKVMMENEKRMDDPEMKMGGGQMMKDETMMKEHGSMTADSVQMLNDPSTMENDAGKTMK